MKRLFYLYILFFVGLNYLSAQANLNLPNDPKLKEEAQRRFALSVDGMMVKDYRGSASASHWLMVNVPMLYDGLYVNAYKAYEKLYEAETDASLKQLYLDSMFISYQLKDQQYELTSTEINNVAYRYYKYYKSDKSKYPIMKAAFDRAYEKPEAVINNNLAAYMDVYRRIFLGTKGVTEDEVLDAYTKIGLVIEQKLATGVSARKLERNKQIVDQMLSSAVSVDCEFIASKLYPELEKDPNNLNLAKKILQLGLTGKCSSEKFFLDAAIVVNKAEPSQAIANMIAKTHTANTDFDLAEKYYYQALSFEQDNVKAAETYLSLAKMYASNGAKSESRTAAEGAMEKDPAQKKNALLLIANLYMGSFDDCKKSQSQIDDRAVFLLAYDIYAMAGDTEGMKSAKAQFPTIGQVFEQNKEEGQKISVGCWIDRTTTIRVRKAN